MTIEFIRSFFVFLTVVLIIISWISLCIACIYILPVNLGIFLSIIISCMVGPPLVFVVICLSKGCK